MTNNSKRIVVALIFGLTLPVSQPKLAKGAVASETRWILGASSLTLRSASGEIKEQFAIGATEQLSSEGYLDLRHEVAVAVDPDGQVAIVIERDLRVVLEGGGGQEELRRIPTETVLARLFDNNGKVLWQLPNVVSDFLRSPLIGKGGRVTLLIQSSAPGCGVESDSGCTEQVIVMSRAGKQLGKFSSVAAVTPLMLSPGGEVGLIGVAPVMREWKIVVFRTSNPDKYQSFNELPGSPVLHDDGRVEFYKNAYGGMGPDGPIIIRKDLVKEIRIK